MNVADLWKFTPLHEASAKGKFEICKLLLKVCTDVIFVQNTSYTRHKATNQKTKEVQNKKFLIK